MIDKKFNGTRLKEALQFRGMKLSELAEKTEISKQSLSLYSNNDNMPPFTNIVKIAKDANDGKVVKAAKAEKKVEVKAETKEETKKATTTKTTAAKKTTTAKKATTAKKTTTKKSAK